MRTCEWCAQRQRGRPWMPDLQGGGKLRPRYTAREFCSHQRNWSLTTDRGDGCRHGSVQTTLSTDRICFVLKPLHLDGRGGLQGEVALLYVGSTFESVATVTILLRLNYFTIFYFHKTQNGTYTHLWPVLWVADSAGE